MEIWKPVKKYEGFYEVSNTGSVRRLTTIIKIGNRNVKFNGKNTKLQLDHIVPISKGGLNRLMNLQTLCNSCNSIKRDTYKDYRYGGR